MGNQSPKHHIVVALETFSFTLPDDLALPPGHTYEARSYLTTTPDQAAERLRDAEILALTIFPLTAELLSESVTPHLRLVIVVASGTNTVDLGACRARGITVVNSPHCNVTSVAEHAIASYFAVRRSLTLSHNMTRAGYWRGGGKPWKVLDDPLGQPPRACHDEIMGIIGNGGVGQAIAARATALGMRVMVAARKGATPTDGRVAFDTVIREASVVVLSLPRSPETMGLISEEALSTMQPHAVIVNVSRGGIVDDVALVAALRAKKIAGAASDVYLEEPAGPENSPLLAPDTADLNLVTTPHIAWCGLDTNINYQRLMRENIASWLLGNPKNVVA